MTALRLTEAELQSIVSTLGPIRPHLVAGHDDVKFPPDAYEALLGAFAEPTTSGGDIRPALE